MRDSELAAKLQRTEESVKLQRARLKVPVFDSHPSHFRNDVPMYTPLAASAAASDFICSRSNGGVANHYRQGLPFV